MNLNKILKNGILILLASLALTACATKKSTETKGSLQGDILRWHPEIELKGRKS